MDELLTISASEIARRIKAGELSSTDAVEAHIKRIEEVNPKLNAVVIDRFEKARTQAKEADERLEKSKDGLTPLFGVPMTIKDTYAMDGYKWAAGVWNRKNTVAHFDATVVERVKEAGAIILGRTNVPEAAMWCETYNHVYGRTNNPYDLKRGVGGSSGGEGSIVAASGSPFGIGSDVGGSIRYPAAFNGVAAHKPSGGLVPGTGHWPSLGGYLGKACTYGPLARRVEDLYLLLSVIAGPDEKDEATENMPLTDPKTVDASKLKVYFFDDNGQVKPDVEVRRAVSMAAGGLQSKGLSTEFWVPQGVENSVEMWSAGMSESDGDSMATMLGGQRPISVIGELIKIALRSSKCTFPAVGTALLESMTGLMKERNKIFLVMIKDLRKRIEDKLGDDGVLICPVFPTPAPLHTHIWLNLFGIGYSGIFNMLHFPATVLPIYHRPDGVPVCVQVVAKRGGDHLTLAAAGLLEEAFGGWKPIEKVG